MSVVEFAALWTCFRCRWINDDEDRCCVQCGAPFAGDEEE